MSSITAQQTNLDLELVLKEKRLNIRKCNGRLNPGKIQREPIFQVVLNALALTLCHSAFLITTDVLEVYMHQFWDSVYKHDTFYRFKIEKMKSLNSLWKSLEISLRFSLEFKGMYHQKNVDYVELLWEDLVYQIDNKVYKKQDKMYYHRFTKVIIHYFLTQDKTLSWRNKIEMHTSKDNYLINTLRFVSAKEETLIYGAILPDSLTKVHRKIMRDFHKTHPSGSGTATKSTSSTAIIKPFVTNDGTGVKPGVPDVTEEELAESKFECWGNDEDDNNNDQDPRSDRTKFLNFLDIPHSDAEIVSPVDVHIQHEVSSQQTPTLLIVHVSVISDSSQVFSIVIPQSLPSFTPPPQQLTSTPPPTTEFINPLSTLPDFASVFQFNNRVTTLEKEVAELRKDDPFKTQVTDLVYEHLDARVGATRDKFMNFLSASITIRITEQVKNQLPQIFLKEVSNFAPPVIQRMVTESLEQEVLAKESSQSQSSYEAAATLTEFELKKTLIDKIDKIKSYFAAPEHRECYEGLKKSYDLDKTFFTVYGKVYSLKRSQKDKDKDEDHSAGSDRRLKKRKTRKDAKPAKGPKAKESQSSSSKSDKSKAKSSGKSIQTKEPEFEVADYDMPHDQKENPYNYDEPKEKRILAITEVNLTKKHGYGYLQKIVVRRSDNEHYKFKEDDFPRLRINDIEDMLLLVVHNRITNISGDDVSYFAIALRMFTRSLVIQK
nr:hypothetical protein [Tanacetum cinerariifolium]